MGLMGSSGQFFAAASSSHFSLLWCGSSPWATVLQDKASPTWVHPKGYKSHQNLLQSGLLIEWHGYSCLHSDSVDICSTMTVSMGCRGMLLHQDLHHGLQGKLSTRTASSPAFSQSFAACRAVCLTAFPHSSHCCAAFCPFLHAFSPELPPCWLWGSALPCGGLVGAVWNCQGLAQGSSSCPSHGPSTAPFASKTSRHCI